MMISWLVRKFKELSRRRQPTDDSWALSPYGRILLEARHRIDELVKRYGNAPE
jgi:hypothetical protein